MKKIESFLVIGILSYLFIELWQITKLIKIVISALIPILIGAFISFLLEPFIIRLEKKNIHRKYGCVIVYILVICIFILFCIMVYPSLKSQFNDFKIYIPQIVAYLSDMNINIHQRMMDIGTTVYQKMVSFFSSLVTIGIGLGAALYISFDFRKVVDFYFQLAPRKYQTRFKELSVELGQAIFMYSRYMLYDTLLFFVLASVIIGLFKIPYALAFGLLLALTNLIPYVGPFIGIIPFAIFGFLNGQGWLCLAIGFGLQVIENNVISPLLLKNMIFLHPVLGIFAMSFFGALFGFWGMVFSRLLIVLCKILFRHLFLLEKSPKIVYNSSEIDDKDK